MIELGKGNLPDPIFAFDKQGIREESRNPARLVLPKAAEAPIKNHDRVCIIKTRIPFLNTAEIGHFERFNNTLLHRQQIGRLEGGSNAGV